MARPTLRQSVAKVVRTAQVDGGHIGQGRLPVPWKFDCPDFDGCVFRAVVEGHCVLDTASATTWLRSGDVVVFPRGTPHSMRSPPRVRDDAAVLICGYFHVEASVRPLIDALPDLVQISSRQSRLTKWLQQTISLLLVEGCEEGPECAALELRVLDVVLIEVLRAWVPNEEGSVGAVVLDRQVAQALALVREQPQADWTVGSLARMVGMSRTRFADLFRRLVGQTPMAYVTAVRMRRAARLLRSDAVEIGDAMERVGYRSLATFSKAFKREMGMPPGVFRRRSTSGDLES